MEVRIEELRAARSGRLVLEVPALGFPAGSTTAVFGPNGAGKTTLLRLIAGLDRPVAGRVTLGSHLVQPSVAARRCIAYAFQEDVFLARSVRTNLELGLRLRGLDHRARRHRVEETASACGIAHLLDRSARGLSGGEAQRANLARALCLRAPVTLLDEPLARLDDAGRVRLLDELPGLLATFATTTVLVTHDRDQAFRLADRLVVTLAGTIRAAGAKADIFRQPPDTDVAALLGYTLVPRPGGRFAIPPGALGLGDGPVRFELVVQRTVDLGTQRELIGRIGDARVSLPLPDGVPSPRAGERVVVASASALAFPPE